MPANVPLPVTAIVPVVDILPEAASIVKGPTVSPLCTTKLLFAMVPYSPRLK
jgi:hypothetical protein